MDIAHTAFAPGSAKRAADRRSAVISGLAGWRTKMPGPSSPVGAEIRTGKGPPGSSQDTTKLLRSYHQPPLFRASGRRRVRPFPCNPRTGKQTCLPHVYMVVIILIDFSEIVNCCRRGYDGDLINFVLHFVSELLNLPISCYNPLLSVFVTLPLFTCYKQVSHTKSGRIPAA